MGKKRPATYADVRESPDQVVAELVDGTLYTSPRPSLSHARAALALGSNLEGPFDRGNGGPGGWIILMESELHLLGQVLVPDLAGWRREQVPELPEAGAFEIAPNWLSEVVSPSTGSLDRKVKLPKYRAAGVEHVWLVDPAAETLEVLRLVSLGAKEERQTYETLAVLSEDDRVRVEPFEGIELDLSTLWRR